MFKVVLWDYTGESAQWAKNFLKDDVEIIRTLRPDDSNQAEVIMRGDWNFVLIFEKDQRELFNETFKTMRAKNFSTDNIIFANDFHSWLNNPAAVYALMKPEAHDQFYRFWNFFNHRRWHHYIAASAEGIHYVGTAADNVIMYLTHMQSKNVLEDDMKIFHDLSKRFYDVDDSEGGIFLELGANIGTTGIYFLKKLAPNLKWLAFEPDPENFKLLRVNTILNDLDDRATLVNCGLGDKFDELTMYKNIINPGGSGLLLGMFPDREESRLPTETVKVIPLDSYLAENKIAASEVKYIWIDTEGFEAQVLLGAKNFLAQNAPPIFMECNQLAWKNSGKLEEMVALLKSVGYTHYILFPLPGIKFTEKLYPLDNLLILPESLKPPLGQTGDIFLIKNLR